jgi:hypothetical protein
LGLAVKSAAQQSDFDPGCSPDRGAVVIAFE